MLTQPEYEDFVMTETKHLGKIVYVNYEFYDGDYNSNAMGWQFELIFDGYCSSKFIQSYEVVRGYMKDAKAGKLTQLVNKPIEVTKIGNTLVDFRILTEVL